MKHFYALVLTLIGFASLGAAFFCPLVKGLIAVILFLVGACLVTNGVKLATGYDMDSKENNG